MRSSSTMVHQTKNSSTKLSFARNQPNLSKNAVSSHPCMLRRDILDQDGLSFVHFFKWNQHIRIYVLGKILLTAAALAFAASCIM
jgi:hypothetical protein